MAQDLNTATFPEAKATEVQQNLMAAKAKIILLLGVQPKMILPLTFPKIP